MKYIIYDWNILIEIIADVEVGLTFLASLFPLPERQTKSNFIWIAYWPPHEYSPGPIPVFRCNSKLKPFWHLLSLSPRPYDPYIYWYLNLWVSNGTSAESGHTDLQLGVETRIMELADSSGELKDHTYSNSKPSEARSRLGIDLNEIPSPTLVETLPDALDVVRAYHDNPPPPPGGPAGLPGEDDARDLGACAACGKPEVSGHVVVCDGCERGFHLRCAGMHGLPALNLDEWVCTECESSGIKSKRWPLGVKSKCILDMNASPPSDIEGDCDGEGMEVLDSRYGVLCIFSFSLLVESLRLIVILSIYL